MKKKICICTTVSVTLKAFVLPTAKYLHDKYGYDVTLVSAPEANFEKSVPEGIKFKAVEMTRGIDINALGSIRELKKFFKEEKFDIVQYATPNAAMYSSIAAKSAGVKKRLYCQWGIRYTGMHGISRVFFKALEKLTCNLSTDIRSVSRLNRQFGIDEHLYSEKKVKVVGNGGTIGVDLQDYDINKKALWRREIREKLGINENDFLFCFCGRISRDKGSEELIRAFKKIERENVKMLIVGKADEKCDVDADILEYIKTSPNVICTGWVNNEQMKMYYSSVDVLVHPTYREGFGMVIQEAGALGIPCITTKIIGASEVMVDGESCLLVEPKNADELQDAMLKLYNDRALVETLGNNAFERTETLYERSIMLNNQAQDYISLLKG